MEESLRKEKAVKAVEEFKKKAHAILCKVEPLDNIIKENQIKDFIAEVTNDIFGIKNKLDIEDPKSFEDRYIYLISRMNEPMKTEINQLITEFKNNIKKIDNE